VLSQIVLCELLLTVLQLMSGNFHRDHSQLMNTVGAAASCVATYLYIHLYMYIWSYIYPVYRCSVCISVNSDFVRTTKSTVEICIYNMLHKITKHLAYCSVIFETELFPSVMIRKRQHLDVLRCSCLLVG